MNESGNKHAWQTCIQNDCMTILYQPPPPPPPPPPPLLPPPPLPPPLLLGGVLADAIVLDNPAETLRLKSPELKLLAKLMRSLPVEL
jgi:hypothetical protein